MRNIHQPGKVVNRLSLYVYLRDRYVGVHKWGPDKSAHTYAKANRHLCDDYMKKF